MIFKSRVDHLSLDIKLAQLQHIINHLMTDFNSLPRLLQCILMSMYLRQYRTILQLKFSNDENLPHPV